MTSQNAETPPFHVLFVCTGNTCRSPLAEAIARRELQKLGLDGVEVGSAGAAAMPGAPASDGALRTGARHGLDLSGHRSTPLTAELLETTDLVLAMSPSHLARVEALRPGVRAALLAGFADGQEGADGPGVPDPFGGDDAVYEETYRALEDLVSRSLGRLEPTISR